MVKFDNKKIMKQFELHELWERTLGKKGKKLSLDEIDFRNIDISNYSLDQAFIAACIFDGMNLIGKDLYASRFCSSTFKGTNLENADFTKADLNYADFTGANIKNAKLNKTDCCETVFMKADLTNALMMGSGFYYADFREATLCNVDVSFSTFEGVLVKGAILRDIKGLSEAFIKSINIGNIENPILIEGKEAECWLINNSFN